MNLRDKYNHAIQVAKGFRMEARPRNATASSTSPAW